MMHGMVMWLEIRNISMVVLMSMIGFLNWLKFNGVRLIVSFIGNFCILFQRMNKKRLIFVIRGHESIHEMAFSYHLLRFLLLPLLVIEVIGKHLRFLIHPKTDVSGGDKHGHNDKTCDSLNIHRGTLSFLRLSFNHHDALCDALLSITVLLQHWFGDLYKAVCLLNDEDGAKDLDKSGYVDSRRVKFE
jgi:hypothetical protein